MVNGPEFTLATIKALAHRAGYACSFPGCNAPTAGPSEEAINATSSVGEACHIRGARLGARRYDAGMTDEQRSAIENGIWMCRTHAKKIDTDEVTYTADIIMQWKKEAEERARQEQGKPRLQHAPHLPLAQDTQKTRVTIEDVLYLEPSGRRAGPPTEVHVDVRARGASVQVPLRCAIEVSIRDQSDDIHYKVQKDLRISHESERVRCRITYRPLTVARPVPARIKVRVFPAPDGPYEIPQGFYGNSYDLIMQNGSKRWIPLQWVVGLDFM